MKRIAFAHVLPSIVLPLMSELIVGFVVLEDRVIRSGGLVHGFIVEVRQLGFVWKLLQWLDIRDGWGLLFGFHGRKLSSIHATRRPAERQGLSVEWVDFVEKPFVEAGARE